MQNVPTTSSNSTEKLQQYLVELNQKKKELETIHDKLENMLHNLNETLTKLDANWSEHREKYYNDLIQQLKEQNIDLTDEEEKRLRYSGSTASSITEVRENLAKIGIKVPPKASDFTIIVCGTVATALSRTLQKPDEAYRITQRLKVIDKENDDANTFKKECERQFNKITNTVTELKTQAAAIKALSPEQQESLKNIAFSISTLKPETVAKPGQEEAKKL